MAEITTARILTDRALSRTCGQECVDWAMDMLGQGHDGYHLAMLAGMSPPLHHFEVCDARDRALLELGLSDISDSVAIRTYAAECLRLALSDNANLFPALRTLADLCIEREYPSDLYDFYLLYQAYTDLMDSEVQWYWDGVDRNNVVTVFRARAEAFLNSAADD